MSAVAILVYNYKVSLLMSFKIVYFLYSVSSAAYKTKQSFNIRTLRSVLLLCANATLLKNRN